MLKYNDHEYFQSGIHKDYLVSLNNYFYLVFGAFFDGVVKTNKSKVLHFLDSSLYVYLIKSYTFNVKLLFSPT